MKLSVADSYEPERRVIQCACGWTRQYRGEAQAIREGWTCAWKWARRQWTCPGCSPKAVPVCETLHSGILLQLFELGRDALAREQLELMLQRDPPRGRAALAVIGARVRRRRKSNRGPWPAWLADLEAGAGIMRAG